MSKQNVLAFLEACGRDPALLAEMEAMPLPALAARAAEAGAAFTAHDLADVVGAMEVRIIMERRGEDICASSSLWREMWGRTRLDYVVNVLHASFTPEERAALAGLLRPPEEP